MRAVTISRRVAGPVGVVVAGVCAAAGGGGGVGGIERSGLEYFAPDRRAAQVAYEDGLIAGVDAARLRAWHDLLAAEPHRAGTRGDLNVIAKIERAFGEMGLEVETFWFEALLPFPVGAELEIVAPEVVKLSVSEPSIAEDPDTQKQAEWLGWNGYSGSGEVTGEVVYANYGRMEDFATLRDLGVDCAGKIVVARYGGNYRGYKAKYAEEAGAAGLIIYTDPRDSGSEKGAVWPEGGWANEHFIQRGSIVTLGYQGDPLTPGVACIDGCERMDLEEVGLPKIPVQPIGWGAAREILSRMNGPEVPDESWRGGLELMYRVAGGAGLRVRLKVEQERRLARTANVLGSIRGERWPDERVIIGCHHDSWEHGAADPLAGTICLMEAAQVFAERAKAGARPDRTITFAAWGAEEMGIIGSSEWVEANCAALHDDAVAYINLDMAAMGPRFGASAWPSLKRVIVDASRVVPQAGDDTLTVHDLWVAGAGRGATEPDIGLLGGGSDHVAFLCRAGVPSMALGSHGSEGTSYHSAYDTLAWYRKVVGEGYEPAVMVTRMTGVVAARLAEADIVPVRPAQVYRDMALHVEALAGECAARSGEAAGADWERLRGAAVQVAEFYDRSDPVLVAALERGEASDGLLRAVNELIRSADRAWTDARDFAPTGVPAAPGPVGLPGNPWYRNAFVSPDFTSGYASWPLPVLRMAAFDGPGVMPDAVERYAAIVRDGLTRARRLLAISSARPPEPAD